MRIASSFVINSLSIENPCFGSRIEDSHISRLGHDLPFVLHLALEATLVIEIRLPPNITRPIHAEKPESERAVKAARSRGDVAVGQNASFIVLEKVPEQL